MLKSVLLLTLISSVSFAQLADKTEACYSAAIKVATYKIAKDSKINGSVLNEIGFVAESCSYDGRQDLILCSDAKGEVQFDVQFDSSNYKQKNNGLNEMSYLFTTGTQGVDVNYELHFVKPKTSNSCTYIKSSVWTDGYEEMSGDKTREEIQMCVSNCLSTYDRPGAELKACIARCDK
ncbi:MAG: hypothetical protein ABL930_05425 [Pseudobdellovibrio sp.]